MFFVKPCFFISFSLQKEEYFWRNKKNKNDEKKVAKLLTYGGQVIDPAVYIYIYMALDRTSAYLVLTENGVALHNKLNKTE